LSHDAPLSPSQAFTSLAIINLLTTPAAKLLGSFPMVAAALGCLQRIEDFLHTETLDDQRVSSNSSAISVKSLPKTVIEVTDVVLATTTEDLNKQGITFHSEKGSVKMVLGPVGSGKSTLLKTILGEHTPRTGRVSVTTPLIGYCSQIPWLPNSSIRDAIIGPAAEIDERLYQEVLDLCQLRQDLSQMPLGDLTEIGSRGLVLSGGQKHRIVSKITILGTYGYAD
jgi:ATP-binding cassette subfamily C (CFTR/MRP) protein 1